MAIKVNGTTVIDDSRNLVNIVSGAGSSTTYGDVGTYIFGYIANNGITQGSTYSGSSINPCGEAVTTATPGTDSDFGSNITVDAASSNSGTWRAMGRSNYNSGLTRGRATLFVRIS
jgi:hypothetical protein